MTAYRNIHSTEAALYQEHLLRLDADSRHARFSGTVSDASMMKYCASIDWDMTSVIGFLARGRLCGAAEIRYEHKVFPDFAELAFSVERPYQSSRVGSRLMERALLRLRNRGVGKAHIVCMLANTRMQRLALRHRCNLQAASGEVFMTINVPKADIGSLAGEISHSYFGWMFSYLDAVMPDMVAQGPMSQHGAAH